MSNNHVLTRNIGNLRGFSTDSSFVRPANVADIAINLQRAPDTTTQIRRGYQCRAANIGGLGTGTFDNPTTGEVETVTINRDGLLYQLLQRQIYLYYDGRVMGSITGATQANPCVILSVGHGLQTGTQVIIQNVGGMTQINNNTYTITVVDPDHFSLNGVDSTSYSAYTSGGDWSIAFANDRYMVLTIFTDPRFLVTNPGWSVAQWSNSPWGSPSGESITCQITVNRAAQVNGTQLLTNMIIVDYGHELAAGDTVIFTTSLGFTAQRNVVSVTTNSITIDGYPVSVSDNTYISQFFDIPFRKGFDVVNPFTIQEFIDTITSPTTGVYGLQVAVNGDTDFPAAFIQILEPTIIDVNNVFTLQYYYWDEVNKTVPITFPGMASTIYQNSEDFENASFAAFDDAIYIADGIDFPQKYDGQNVYRVGMPEGMRPQAIDNTGAAIKPFSTSDVLTYGITYEQIDHLGHLVEGAISELRPHTVGATAAIDVTVNDILANSGWNTDGALAVGGLATVYGPDINGFYYDAVNVVDTPHTMNIGDNAFYQDQVIATVNGAQANVNTIVVDSGHGVEVGDTVVFQDTTPTVRIRLVTQISSVSITVQGSPVTVADNATIAANKVSQVFGDIAIIDGDQSNVNVIAVKAGQSIQVGDIAAFTDSSGRIQRREVTNVTGTSITIDGIPVSVDDLFLITTETIRSTVINLQRTNPTGTTLGANAPISNNLRINIWRTEVGGTLLKLVYTIPNNSLGAATQTFLDDISDAELGLDFDNPVRLPNPPPISKYLLSYGNQLLYAGGKRGDPLNSDNVFFSEGNQPESVPAATNFFSLPSPDDDVTGIGSAGTTLIAFKGRSIYAVTGDLLTSQFQVTPIAPGTNIGCVANASIQSVGSLLYFLHTNGVYAITENQLYPTDPFGNPIAISSPIEAIFRETNFLPQTRYVLKRAVALNYTKDNQYLLFLPCEDVQTSQRVANQNSVILCYDYQGKNWYQWTNMNAAGGMFVINDNLFFQERRFSGIDGNTANLYKQHRFYRLIDHADHAGPQRVAWKSSWEDMGQPEVRKKFVRCVLLMNRLSDLDQFNNPQMQFSSYLDRIPNLQNTIAQITTVNNTMNSGWAKSPWGWGIWSGYQDTFARINLKRGTVSKSMQVGFTITGINMDIRFAGFQLEAVPEFRKTIVR